MCGICGILDFSSHFIDEQKLVKMAQAIQHRGPDNTGIYTAGNVGLGHTRLSILDLSKNANQPFFDRNNEVSIVYNGEIYNYLDVKKDLKDGGCEFKTSSDTEVLLHSYLKWGVDSFKLFKGMFAFALWDERINTLYLVRDRFGIKPLFYYNFNNGVTFGSEIKSILLSGYYSVEMNHDVLHEYLYYGSSLGEETFFDGLLNLPPGHYLEVKDGATKLSPYALNFNVSAVMDDIPNAVANVRLKLEQAVCSHLVSDVPVGVFLSGGIDSSAITAFASRNYNGLLKTFSVGFDFDPQVSELFKAKEVANYFGTDHNELHISCGDVASVIEALVKHHDEPFGDPANIPLYLLCDELKGSAKVILQGDGGDEVFGGYRRYSVFHYERLWRLLAEIACRVGPGFKLLDSAKYFRYMRFFEALLHPSDYMRMALLMTEETIRNSPTRILSKDVCNKIAGVDPFEKYRQFFEQFSELDPVQRMLYTDANIILPDVFLEKVDRATMAHGIEVRVPMLDVDLAEYVMGLPAAFKLNGGRKKWLLRKALRGVVPDKILDSPKRGFGVPVSSWLRGPLKEYMKSILLDPQTVKSGFYDTENLVSCINDHIDGHKNNGPLLYKLINYSLWHQFYFTEKMYK